ncbi:hypothetical protein OUZ56_003027 [Daphnia magna]|uniref:Uncharacterized protein n=1 Tax=Daphnia magna TaxID=35525 RepID=A0ABR0A7I5_9CRUS|nr:hypothetical protein OUZ56_003027 [Daphnia magna]
MTLTMWVEDMEEQVEVVHLALSTSVPRSVEVESTPSLSSYVGLRNIRSLQSNLPTRNNNCRLIESTGFCCH